MTTPTILALGLSGDYHDFLEAPGFSDGALRMVQNQVTVAAATGTVDGGSYIDTTDGSGYQLE